MYSVQIKCIKEEVEGEIKTKLDIPFDPLKLDWLGNEEKMKNSSEFSITSTPIFLLGDDKSKEEEDNKENEGDESKEKGKRNNNRPSGLSKIALISIIAGSIIGVIIIVIVGFFCYKAFIQKKEPQEDGQVEALMKD